jgi:plastocyanin domain-containing protein
MPAKILVTAAGILLIVFINWYFLFPRRKKNL